MFNWPSIFNINNVKYIFCAYMLSNRFRSRYDKLLYYYFKYLVIWFISSLLVSYELVNLIWIISEAVVSESGDNQKDTKNESKKNSKLIKILSVAQFRPEKDHPLQLRSLYQLRQMVPEPIWDRVSKLLLI